MTREEWKETEGEMKREWEVGTDWIGIMGKEKRARNEKGGRRDTEGKRGDHMNRNGKEW